MKRYINKKESATVMPRRHLVSDVITTSIISAFTIAAALIWRDVVTDIIMILVPIGDRIYYKALAAVIATVFVIIAIYIVLNAEKKAEHFVHETEREATRFWRRFKNGKQRRHTRRLKK